MKKIVREMSEPSFMVYVGSNEEGFVQSGNDILSEKGISKDGGLSINQNSTNPSKVQNVEVIQTSDANKLNHQFRNRLEALKPDILYLLHHTDFEDGRHNELSRLTQRLIELNQHCTLLWLYELDGDNQDDAIVRAGILRLLGLIDIKGSQSTFMSLIKSGLIDKNTYVNEASLMLIESWRSQQCLDALRVLNYEYLPMARYVSNLVKELEEEHSKC